MSLGLVGKKVGMTRVFDKDAGIMIPVNVIDVSGNEFLQVKTTETDGYSAVQIGYDEQKEQRLNKAQLGHIKKNNGSAKKLIKEFRFESDEQLPNTEEAHPGAAVFEDGQTVDVIGTTKGKGFQGVVKRYNFAGQPDSHGHMMHSTVQNLKIVQVRPEDNVVLVSGAVPGPNGGYVIVRPAVKAAK